jgi:cation diffusion facilitator CzcD-associated flavoprotein CzcO
VETHTELNDKIASVIIVGAGPAGLGVAIALQKMAVDYIIIEKDSIGASFKKWPEETKFISPSFTGNFFKMPDLNSISPDSSPAFSLLTEHPTGEEYVAYLESISEYNKLKIHTGVQLNNIEQTDRYFSLDTSKGEYRCVYVIWAAGEYQYPKQNSFPGQDLCVHFSEIESFEDYPGDDVAIVGAYESGFDAAVNLSHAGKQVTIFDGESYVELVNSDSSYSLSPFTRDRLAEVFDDLIYHKNTKVTQVQFQDGIYSIETDQDITLTTKTKPICCNGFDSSLTLVKDFFDFHEDYPLINGMDESTKTENFFLVGPQVKHSEALFCFVYKYRQRFAIVAEKIAKRIGSPERLIEETIEEYKSNNFYLDDLSCCDNECSC